MLTLHARDVYTFLSQATQGQSLAILNQYGVSFFCYALLLLCNTIGSIRVDIACV